MWFMLRKDWQGNWKRSIRAPKKNPKNPLEQGEVIAILDLAPGQAVEVTDPYEIEFLSKDLKTDKQDGPLLECAPKSTATATPVDLKLPKQTATPVDLKLPKPAAAEEAASSGGDSSSAAEPTSDVSGAGESSADSAEEVGAETKRSGRKR